MDIWRSAWCGPLYVTTFTLATKRSNAKTRLRFAVSAENAIISVESSLALDMQG